MKWRLLSVVAFIIAVVPGSVTTASIVSPAKPEPTVFAAKPGDPLPDLTSSELKRFDQGRDAFQEVEEEKNGLGPAFNGTGCGNCHVIPAVGGGAFITENRAGKRLDNGDFQPVDYSHSRTLFRLFSITYGDHLCQELIPDEANVVSKRVSIALFGDGLVEAIPDDAIVGEQQRQASDSRTSSLGITGRAAAVTDPAAKTQRIGRFGWKAQIATLLGFSGDAYNNEMGITNPIFPQELASISPDMIQQCDRIRDPEDKGEDIQKFTDFMTFLAPAPRVNPADPQVIQGEQVFESVGCSICHKPAYKTAPDNASTALRSKTVPLFSDLLLHDIGTGDGVPQAAATGSEFVTAKLWGLYLRKPYLHDGRAVTVQEAILQHGEEAASVREAFVSLEQSKREALLAFLRSL